MTADILVRYAHFVSIILLIGSVIGELYLLKPAMARIEIGKLAKLDQVYGATAVLVLATGLLQWFAVGKPADFYSQNPVFHAKFTLFLVVGLLSIYPTIYFAKQRKGNAEESVPIPSLIRRTLQVELALLAAMPLLASLMAQGIGLSVE